MYSGGRAYKFGICICMHIKYSLVHVNIYTDEKYFVAVPRIYFHLIIIELAVKFNSVTRNCQLQEG